MKENKISPEQFIEIWNNSISVNEIVKSTGMKKTAVYGRANNYKRHGVQLKIFRAKINWAELKKIAEKSNKGK